MRSRRRQLTLLVSFALAAGLAAACAEQRPPISRVQANALAKSVFVGAIDDPGDDPEFYMRTSVVDVAAGAGSDGLFTSSDSEPTSRIRWDITEKLLIARLTYELVQDTDYKGVRRTPDGQAVAAFTIEKHFDIKRDYNPTTGEPLNVIVENDTDRPWYQREYFRIDWSRNLITDAYDLDSLSQLGIWYGVKLDPIAYYVADPNSPDAPVFDLERGYFDITHKAWASPQIISDPEWGDYPACWEYGRFPLDNCNPSEITLRTAFLKVVDNDFEPLHWDGTRMDMFGWFTMDRFGYDRRYGVVDEKWHRFATRWNLYERSHPDPVVPCNTPATTPTGKSPNRDEDGDGTEDECAVVGRGSRCDIFRGECTIPLRDRQVRTIPWHVNRGFPEELFAGAAAALDGWSDAIRVGIVAGRLAECRRTGEEGCEAQMGWPSPWADDYIPPLGRGSPAEVPKLFVLCHNPVDPGLGDAPECGEAGTSPRLGDLRYHSINIINEPQQMAPWGIYMDAEDPLTGEKIAGSVNQWGAALDRYASTLVDLVGLLNGWIDPDQFITGRNVSDWVQANRPGGPATRGTAMSAAEVAARQAAFDPKVLERYLTGLSDGRGGKRVPPAVRHRNRVAKLVESGKLGPGNDGLMQRLRTLRGSALEATVVSPDLGQAAGFDPSTPLSAEAIKHASPFGRSNPAVRRAEQRNRRLAQAQRHSCRLEDVEPDNLIGMAREAARLFPAPDPNDLSAVNAHRQALWRWARQQYSQGVLAHEMGHSMGLRHNFAASFDALNYRGQYWQLRTRNAAVTAPCPAGTTDGTDCIGPRWRDPLTDEEVENNINKYATSSVMDYPGDQNHDTLLLGKFDRAAMRFGYGGVVDVWSSPDVTVGVGSAYRDVAYKLTAFTTQPGLFGIYYFPPIDPSDPYLWIHYSQYQNEFGLLRSCTASDAPDAILGHKCQELPMDVVDYRDMRDFAPDPDYAVFSWAVNPRAVDPRGRVRRGYLFSSDEYADTGNVPSFTYDAGADAYEQIKFLEMAYENRYLLDGFRRNRVMFTSWDTIERIQAHYLDAIQLIAKTYAFGAVLDGDPTQPTSDFLQDGYYGPLSMGATVALELFARILTRPEPGYYCPADVCGTAQPLGVSTPLYSADWAPLPDVWLYDFRVALGDGRYVHNDYDYSQGYWWSDYQTQVGTYYEKVWATYYLAEAFDFFISNSKEDFTDGRYKNVNFATVFPEQVRRLYANLFTGAYDVYSPWVVVPSNPDDTPLGTLRYPTWYDRTSLGPRPANALLADPNYSWNEQLYAMVWGAMFFPTNWSLGWINEARITVLAADQVEWPPAETYTYRDPESGLTYRAHAVGREQVFGRDVQRGVGARMLEWANQLLVLAYLVERDGFGQPVLNADGTPKLVLDANGRPQPDPANPGAVAALRKHVDNVGILRQLTSTFDRSLTDPELPQP
ncbi:MAG: zinc-dependent metalloprotease [Deltaproteobacteria bacterium]|nr:zinc-dependent metalloprotease [Deltaproteobacteria bacterium]